MTWERHTDFRPTQVFRARRMKLNSLLLSDTEEVVTIEVGGNQVQLPRYECKMQVLWPATTPEFGGGSQQCEWKLVQVYIQLCDRSWMAWICWPFRQPPVIMKSKDNTIGVLTVQSPCWHMNDFWWHYTRTSLHWLIRETDIEWEKQKSQWSERQGLTAETVPSLGLILLDSTCARLRLFWHLWQQFGLIELHGFSHPSERSRSQNLKLP